MISVHLARLAARNPDCFAFFLDSGKRCWLTLANILVPRFPVPKMVKIMLFFPQLLCLWKNQKYCRRDPRRLYLINVYLDRLGKNQLVKSIYLYCICLILNCSSSWNTHLSSHIHLSWFGNLHLKSQILPIRVLILLQAVKGVFRNDSDM